jgi:DNA ligase (NAD+)
VQSWFADTANQKNLAELLPYLTIEKSTKTATAQTLAGKTFVLTGSLDTFTRDEAKTAIQTLGGKVSSSVSKKTDYVVVGSEPGSKAQEAQRLKVTLLSEAEFTQLVAR